MQGSPRSARVLRARLRARVGSCVARLRSRLGLRLRVKLGGPTRRGPPGDAPTADALGRRGERAAARWLRREGLSILARRLRTRGGEIDLLARDGSTLVLVEVKSTRATPSDGAVRRDPAVRVDHVKRRRLSTALRALLDSVGPARPHRIDVVTVLFDGRRTTVRHLVGAVRVGRRA